MKGSQRLSLLVATLVLLLIVWGAAHPTPSSAHAFPSRSSPEPGSVLEGPPSRVDIWFTERVTPKVSSIEVFDVSRRRVDSGDSTVDPQDPYHMSVGVTTLPTGLYTVVWSNVSADDGHPNKGGYAFTVLEPTATPLPASAGVQGPPGIAPTPAATTTPLPLPSEADQAATQLLNPATDRPTAAVDLVAGWLAFTTLVLAGGGAAFVLLCLLPAFRTAGLAGSSLPPLVGRFLILVVLYGIIGAVGAFVSLLAKAEIATGLPPGDLVSGVVLGALLAPWSGRVWLVREGALLAMAALGIAGLVLRRRAPVPILPLAGIATLGAVGVVFQALGSHVAAGHVARPWPLGAPVLALHLLAVGLWVGGLGFAPLMWPVWRKASAEARAALAAGAIARFSTLALPSVVVIAVTGVYLALVLLPLPGDLLSSSYGQAIDVKTALFIALLGFGALNRRTLRTLRRSRSDRPDGAPAAVAIVGGSAGTASEPFGGVTVIVRAGTRLLRAMRRELALAAVVLLAAGTMLEVGPPGTALSAQAVKLEDSVALAAVPVTPTPVPSTPTPAPTVIPAVYASTATVGDLTLALDATPTLAGATTAFTVSVAGANGAPVSEAQVKLFLTAESTDLGSQALTLSAEAPGRYRVAAPVFALAGNWNVQLVVRRDNFPERDQTFVVPVRAPALPATPTPVTTTVQPTSVPQRLDGALALQPDPPVVGRDHATLRLRDAAGRPVAGAQVLGLWLMPEHAHLEQSSLPETIAVPGTYEADVPLSMAGAWLADVNIRMADGRAAHVRFAFNVRDRGLLGVAAPIARTVALASAPPSTTAAAAAEAAPLATLSQEAHAAATSESIEPATLAPAATSPIADSIRAPPSTMAPTSVTATLDGGLAQRQRIGDLDVDARITPRVFQPAAIDVRLAKPDGTTPTDVTRVDVQFAMEGMSHGARGVVAIPDGPGRYHAQGMVLVMEGPWWMALRIERAGGRVDSGVFGFRVPADRPSGAVSALTDRPNDPVQIVDIAVYPGGVDPSSVVVRAGHPVRLEVVYIDHPPCGPELQVTTLGLRAAVTSSGLAELTFVPANSATLRIDCEQAGLFLRSA